MTQPLVALMQPSAGYAVPYKKAAKAFYRPSARGVNRLELEQGTTSTTRTFNTLLCDALNHARQHPITHLAMIHDDVGPDGPWLDVLMDELDRTGAFLISAVVPIRNQHGLTSTAVDVGADYWTVRRLSMHEVFTLPETFGAKDVPWNSDGAALLANTGLWVARFDPRVWEAYADPNRRQDGQSGFRFLNRIDRCPSTGEFVSQDIAEDWDLSRQLHALNCEVRVTRKVVLEHGHPMYHTRHAWGDWPTDLGYLEYTRRWHTVPGELPGWIFPATVPGWLSEAEGQKLAELARDRDVLEIGSYLGKSTICLAQTANYVHAVDPFDGRATSEPRDTLAGFLENICRHGVLAKVTTHKGTSEMILPDMKERFDLIFIDGNHSARAVARDARMAQALLKPGGLLAFHDYLRPCDPGVTEAVDEYLESGAELIERVDSLAVVRPPVGVLAAV